MAGNGDGSIVVATDARRIALLLLLLISTEPKRYQRQYGVICIPQIMSFETFGKSRCSRFLPHSSIWFSSVWLLSHSELVRSCCCCCCTARGSRRCQSPIARTHDTVMERDTFYRVSLIVLSSASSRHHRVHFHAGRPNTLFALPSSALEKQCRSLSQRYCQQKCHCST